jgi:general secretion pathway protein L
MINQFAGWWGRQLLSLLPDRMRGRDADEGRSFLITLVSSPGAAQEAVDVQAPAAARRAAAERLLLDEGGLTRLRALRARAPRAPVHLRLRAGSLLERDVMLPLAAERGLDRVLQYEMDRLTPFTAAETFWGWTVTRRDRAHGRLHLRLTLGPRGPVTSVIDKLTSAGASPTLLESRATPDGDGLRRIDLASREGRGGARVTPALRVGMALCAVLLLVLIGLPFLRQSIALGAVTTQIEALRPTVAEATRLRRDIEAQAAGGSMLAAVRQQVGDPLRAIAAVTNALPDDSWLTDLTLQQRKLRIDGESRTAVQLIARLAADPTIIDPAFAAPVTRDDSTHADLFSISADVAP